MMDHTYEGGEVSLSNEKKLYTYKDDDGVVSNVEFVQEGDSVVIQQPEVSSPSYVQTLPDGTTIHFIHLDNSMLAQNSPRASTSQDVSAGDSGYFGNSTARGSSLGDSNLMDASEINTPPSTVDKLNLSRLDLNSPMSVLANCGGPQMTSTPETPDYGDLGVVGMDVQQTSEGLTVKKSSVLPRPMIVSGSSGSRGYFQGLPPEGHTPTRESAIEISQLTHPGEGYFSRENLRGSQSTGRVNCNLQTSRLRQARRMAQLNNLESTPLAQQRVGGGSHQRERTPSPPPRLDLDADIEPTHPSGGLKTNQKIKPPALISFKSVLPGISGLSFSGKKLSSQPPQKMVISLGKSSNKTSTISSLNALSASSNLLSSGQSSLISIPSIAANVATSGIKSEPGVDSQPKIIQYSLTGNNRSELQLPPAIQTISQQDSKAFDPGPRDDSLTNIQWLGKMTGEKLVPQGSASRLVFGSPQLPINAEVVPDVKGQSLLTGAAAASHVIIQGGTSVVIASEPEKDTEIHRDIRIIASEKQIEKISKECGRKKRPPYSYMHLIQMAISSKSDKRMTLREIYKWIEEKFPYYKYCPKQGWKNSIRHNLSLYDIFVRQKSNIPGQTGCSYWTLKPDAMSKSTKPTPKYTTSSDPCSSPMIQVINPGSPQILYLNNNGSTSNSSSIDTANQIMKPRKGKGPAPLLPKPPPMQAYALIPIAGSSVPVVSSQPLIMSSFAMGAGTSTGSVVSLPSATTLTTQANSLVSSATKSVSYAGTSASSKIGLKRALQNGGGPPQKRQVKIAPKVNILSRRPSVLSASRSNGHDLSVNGMGYKTSNKSQSSSHGATSLDTTDLQHQLSAIKFGDSGIDLGKSSSDLSDLPSSQERPKNETLGLPRPKIYRHKKPRKEKQECRQDSSEKEKSILLGQESASNLSSIVAKIEKNFTSPMRVLLRTPTKDKEGAVRTSTPFKGSPNSPGSWISPIRGLTPGSGDKMLDLDSGFLTPEAKMTLHLTGSSSSGKSKKLGSPEFLGSLRELGLPGLTPLKTPGGGIIFPGDSPNSTLNLSNQSFTKLLGDIHLDSMMEEGIAIDMANLSWSALQ